MNRRDFTILCLAGLGTSNAQAFMETRKERNLRESGITTLKQPFVPQKKVTRLLVSFVGDTDNPEELPEFERFVLWARRDSNLFDFSLHHAPGADGVNQRVFYAAKLFAPELLEVYMELMYVAKARKEKELAEVFARDARTSEGYKTILDISKSFRVDSEVKGINELLRRSALSETPSVVVGGRAAFSETDKAMRFMTQTINDLVGQQGSRK